MNPRALSLASGVLPEFGPEETARAAVAAGWDAVGLWVEAKDWTAATTRAVRAVMDGSGLYVLDVEVVWLRTGPLDPDHLRIIDVGAEVGARNVLVVSSDPEPAATADKFARLVEHGAQRGVRPSLEFGVFTAVKTLQDALAVLDLAGPGGGLLVDPLHLSRSGGSPAALAAVAPARFAYAQFCDAPAHGPAPTDVEAIIEEALDLRLGPGLGALPLAELLQVLPPTAPLSLEVRSKPLRDAHPDPADRARVLLAQTRAGLARIEAAAARTH